MRHVRRHGAALLSLLCVAAGVGLLLLALDARTWRTTVAQDDLRFRALPTHLGLWEPQTSLPGDPAGALLGTGDTMAYRRALQLFWYSRIGSNPEERQDLPTLRASAQRRLQDLTDQGLSAHERSYAANLLGVLVVTTPAPAQDTGAIAQILKRASGYFQQAIRIDSGNADAKLNLELVLRVTKPGKGSLSKDARKGYGFGWGRAATPAGSGY
ncbi:MAG: hypothetical protein ACXVRJ_08755 [Gaiellaceae bacterium]